MSAIEYNFQPHDQAGSFEHHCSLSLMLIKKEPPKPSPKIFYPSRWDQLFQTIITVHFLYIKRKNVCITKKEKKKQTHAHHIIYTEKHTCVYK